MAVLSRGATTTYSLFFILQTLVAVPHGAAEYISDLGSIVAPSPADENRALEIKAEKFWDTILTTAEEMKMTEHLDICAEAEKVIAQLPAENDYVRQGLSEAVESLRRADQMVLTQGVQSSGVAADRLSAPAGSSSFSSFFNGGGWQNLFKSSLQRFVAGSRYPERLVEHVNQRQADILPILEGAASSSGNVLKDTRKASTRSFDVLKYDIYNKGVPKTPQAAKDVAYKLVDAAGETRHRFMQFITGMANSIAKDAEGKREDPSATVALAFRGAAETRFVSDTEQVVNL